MKKCRGKPRVISESQRLYSPEAEIISSISPPFLPPFFFGFIFFFPSQLLSLPSEPMGNITEYNTGL